MRWLDSIDNRSPKVYELMTTIKRTDISPISAQSWTKHLQSHFVQPQESAPHLIPGRFNLPTRSVTQWPIAV